MASITKKSLSAFLALALVLSFIPASILPKIAFAEDDNAPSEIILEPSNIEDIKEAAKSGGIIPVPQFDSGSNASSISTYSNDNLPASFDLRSANGKSLVTEVKNQNPWGDCWSFGSNGAAEVSLASSLGKTTNDLDLSERHTAWFLNTPLSSNPDLLPSSAKSQAGEGQIYNGTGNGRMGTGGNSLQAAQMFASGAGITSESVAPYDNNGKTMASNATWEVSDSLRFSSVARLKDYNSLGSTVSDDSSFNSTALTNVKNELIAGRAVEMSYKADQAQPGASADSTYMNRDTWGQYNPNRDNPNHSVLVVGYDDNFSKNNFNTTPEGDGAFIVKNSWGHSETDSGLSYGDVNYGTYGIDNSGYFYLSYYDKTISSFASFEFDGDSYSSSAYDVNEKIIDQYDFMPFMSSGGFGSSSSSYMAGSIFTASEDQMLESVVGYATNDGMTLNVNVYKLNSGATNPEDGEKIASASKTFTYAGIHSVGLVAESGKDLKINKGDKYAVTINSKTTNGFYYVSYQENFSSSSASSSGYSFYGNAVVNAGESFIKSFDDSTYQYTWKDWNADNLGFDEGFKSTYVLDNPMIKVYATKTAGSTDHKVSYSVDGSTQTITGAPTSFKEGGSITLPNAPSKAGYTFDGWYKDSALSTKAGDAGATYSPSETADITLYAKYSAKTTTITWDLQSGTSTTITNLNGKATSVLTYGSASSVLADNNCVAPTRTGYTFTGFYDSATSGTKYINADLSSAKAWDKDAATATLYAQWTANTYNLTYIVDGTVDTTITPKTWVFGSNNNRITLSTPSKVGYTFDGWYTDNACTKKLSTDGLSFNTTYYSDMSLYGRFVAKETSLTFDMAGGTATTAPSGVKATFGQDMTALVAANIPTKTDNRFDGFFDAKTGGTKYYNADGTSAKAWDKDVDSATLYAHWVSTAAPTHSVTFKDGDISLSIAGAPTEFSEGGSIVLPTAPEKTGYDFAGWYTDASLSTKAGDATEHYSPSGTADITLYAKYSAKTFKVTYKFNSDAADVEANRAYGTAYSLLDPSSDQKPDNNATFAGWFKTYDSATGEFGDQVTSIDATDMAEYTLYAKWTYSFIEGKNVTISIKSSDNVVIRVDFPLDRLISITINGVNIKSLVNGTDYTLVSGSTLLTIMNSYVKSMNVGSNEVVFTYDNGVAVANVTVENDEPVTPDPDPEPTPTPTPEPESPESGNLSDDSDVSSNQGGEAVKASKKTKMAKTGDETHLAVGLGLSVLCAIACLLIVSTRRKKSLK